MTNASENLVTLCNMQDHYYLHSLRTTLRLPYAEYRILAISIMSGHRSGAHYASTPLICAVENQQTWTYMGSCGARL
jgi:hypothetical protein